MRTGPRALWTDQIGAAWLCTNLDALLFHSFGSQEPPVSMRFKAWAARIQNAPLSGSGATRRTVDGGQLLSRQWLCAVEKNFRHFRGHSGPVGPRPWTIAPLVASRVK
jgi:hypothetical protein